MNRLKMSNNHNLSNFIDNTIEALQARWSKSKTENKTRVLEKEQFFEKFGTLLKQQSSQFLLQTKREVTPRDESFEAQELFITNKPHQTENHASSANTNRDQDLHTNDLSIAATSDADTIKDLYEKVLLEIINGKFDKQDLSEKTLFAYAQDVFKFNEKTHDEVLKHARSKPTSEVYLRVEIIEAKLTEQPNLPDRCNPFVIMYLQSGFPDVVRSSILESTNNPIWKESFTLPTSENSKDNLILEMFHHDVDMTKVNKTIRVCRKYAFSCIRPRSSYQKLIGRASIPIESISSSGLVMWYTLNKKRRTDPQGTIKLKFHFSSAQNKTKAIEEHVMLIRMFLEYELNCSSVARYWWSGKFTAAGEAILKQHAICADLNENEKSFIYWNAYTSIHVIYPIAFTLFENLINKICLLVKKDCASVDDLKIFWGGVKKLLPSCFAVIIKLRKRIAGDKDIMKTVTSVLNILVRVDSIRETCDIELFSPKDYDHFKHKIEQNPSISIRDVTLLAVRAGAKSWFDQSVANSTKSTFSDEEKLHNSILLIQLLQNDIKRASTYYNNIFKTIMDVEYTRELCKQHEASIVTHLKPIVEKICKGFKKLTIRLDQYNRIGEMEALDMSSTLFELYIMMKLFHEETDKEIKCVHNSEVINYHTWFKGGVSHWSDVFALKALARLSQAIDADSLVAEENVQPKQSSSAVEFSHIVLQMKTFWEQLAWPDQNDLNRFLKRSLGDICSCCIYYADRISSKLKPAEDRKHINMASTIELMDKCALVNSNLSILIEILVSLPNDLGYRQVDINAKDSSEHMLPIEGLKSWKTKVLTLLTDHCMSVIRISMVDSMSKFSQIKENIDSFATQTSALIRDNLVDHDLRQVEAELWKMLSAEFSNLIKYSIERKAPITSFSNLKGCYAIITQAYLPELQDLQNDSVLAEKLLLIEKQLCLYSSSTRDLIHQYYLACFEAQNRLDEPDRGILTVRCCFNYDTLEVQVIGAENIRLPLDFKGTCDSYVKINLVPGYRFPNVQMPKTRTKSKNHSPTYNEKFILKLSQEQQEITDALLVFNVKVSEMLGLNQRHVGECFIRLDSIPVLGVDQNIQSVDIQQLYLTLPENIDSECIPVLEYRQNDKEASQFFKKLKQKLGKAAYTGSVISIF